MMPHKLPVVRVLVVLSERVHTNPDRLTDETRLRCAAALRAWHDAEDRNSPYHVIVVSGGVFVPGQKVPSAELMAEYLESHGMPRELITLETMSLDTYDNARYTLEELIEKFPGCRFHITLATDELHFLRARQIFHALGGPKVLWVDLVCADYFPGVKQAALELLGFAYAEFVDAKGTTWLPSWIRQRRAKKV